MCEYVFLARIPKAYNIFLASNLVNVSALLLSTWLLIQNLLLSLSSNWFTPPDTIEFPFLIAPWKYL